jgi:hypothetical protein
MGDKTAPRMGGENGMQPGNNVTVVDTLPIYWDDRLIGRKLDGRMNRQ